MSAGSFYSSKSSTTVASLSAMNEIQTIAQHVEAKTNYLMTLKDGIENMPVVHQIEILRILTRHKEVIINENKYGIHINLSDLNNPVLDELLIYVNYVSTQEKELNNVEKQKETYKNTYFLKDNKDNFGNYINKHVS